MSLQEVATETGSNIEAVKKRMARARLLLEATSTRAAARSFVEYEALSPLRGNPEKGLPLQALAAKPASVDQSVEAGHVHQVERYGVREAGVAYVAAERLEPLRAEPGWLRWRRSRPLAALLTACALLLLMVVVLSLVKLCTDLLTQVGPHLGA